MALSAADVRKVAQLARLELADNEVESLGKHINELLLRFEELQQLDVEGIEPTSHSIRLVNVLRDDLAVPSLKPAEFLDAAPESRDGTFVVPRILED